MPSKHPHHPHHLLRFPLLLSPILLCSNGVIGTDYRISDAEGFKDFVNSVNSGTNDYSGTTVLLESDLSLSGKTLEPIGKDSSNFFRGVFDGQGHIISDLTMASSLQYTGLFGYSTGLTIRNVVLDSSCSISSSFSGSNTAYVGGIIGECYSSDSQCNIENSVNLASVSSSVKITNDGSQLNVGGIIGCLDSSSSYIKNCANYGSVRHAGASYYSQIGGIVGYLGSTSSIYIQNCINYGAITHSDTLSVFLIIGGITGLCWYAAIENCVSVGTIPSTTSGISGIFVGQIIYTTSVHNCHYTSDVGISDLYGEGSPTSGEGTQTSPATVDLTLIDNLNNYASKNDTWNKWLLNAGSNDITFIIDKGKGFTINHKIILLPDIAAVDSEYPFYGWYSDEALSSPFTDSEVKASTTLYGSLSPPITYTVTLDVNGGNELNEGENKMFVEKNGNYGELPTPERTGYSFAGWFTKSEGGENIEAGDKVTNSNNHTLYAQWNVNNYTLRFILSNGNEDDVKTINYNEKIAYPINPVKEGYSFVGWSQNPDAMPAYNLNITAQWEINNYTLRFIFNNGSEDDVMTLNYSGDVVYPTEPKKEGYTFNEWDKTDITTMPAQDLNITAQWKINNYTLRFIFGNDDIDVVKTLNYNEKIAYPINPVKEGYSFVGWSQNPDAMPAYNLNITAQWEINNYTLRFIFNNGSEDDVRTLNYSGDVVYPTEPKKEGYAFNEWDKTDITTMPAYNLNITAQWIPNNYTVTFSFDNGTNITKGITFDREYGTLPVAEERIGHTFSGWFTVESKVVTSKSFVNIPGNHTLFARYTINNYTMLFNFGNGTVADTTFSYNSTIKYPDNPERKGYSFDGWDINITNIPAYNLNITSLWIPNNYTVTFDFDNGTSETKVVTFDREYGTLPVARERVGHTFSGWFTAESKGITSKSFVNIPDNHTLSARYTPNNYTVIFIYDNKVIANYSLTFNTPIKFNEKNPTKAFYKFDKWCTEDNICLYEPVPARNIILYAHITIDAGAVSGTIIGSLVGVSLLAILIIVLVLAILILKKGLKIGHEAIDIEMSQVSIVKGYNDDDSRIIKHMCVTNILNDTENKIKKYLGRKGKGRALNEVFNDLGVDYSNSPYGISESFKVMGVVSSIVNNLQNNANLAAIGSYLTLLFAAAREQEDFETFEKLYFGMKDVNKFIHAKKDSGVIKFESIVAGFTDKAKVIRLLSEGEEDNLPRGVLFKVQNGKGYNVESQGEVLFELNSVFSIDKMEEIIRDRYIVVKLSYTSPNSEDEMINI